MASIGQLVDRALADPTVRRFVGTHHVDQYIVNLNLTRDQGPCVPAGSGLGSCENPHEFVRVEIDP